MTKSLAARSEVDKRFTWDGESVFPGDSGWERAVEEILSRLPDLEEFKGHLGDSPDTLADWFDANERAHRLMAKVMVYTTMSYSVDVGDQTAAARTDRARSVAAQLGAASSFAVPEMLSIGLPKLREWVAASPRLGHLGHYFDRMEKLQKRIRSAEVEELLTQVSDPLATALSVHSVLANTDLKFAPAIGADGELHEVAQGTIAALMTNPDREVRRTAFESYADEHLRMQHAMAASLAGGVKRDVFFARARVRVLPGGCPRAEPHPGRGLPKRRPDLPRQRRHVAPLLAHPSSGAGRRGVEALRHARAVEPPRTRGAL